jgi:hypothetical protein
MQCVLAMNPELIRGTKPSQKSEIATPYGLAMTFYRGDPIDLLWRR